MKRSLLLQLAFARLPVVAGILVAASSHFREKRKISDSVTQIRALQAEKASRSALHRKLDSQFVFELSAASGQAIAAAAQDLQPNIDASRMVVCWSISTPPSGGNYPGIIHSSPRFHSIRAQAAHMPGRNTPKPGKSWQTNCRNKHQLWIVDPISPNPSGSIES
jgi:hypothetical protein